MVGLPFIELTTNIDNLPSRRMTLANGGRSLGRFTNPKRWAAETV